MSIDLNKNQDFRLQKKSELSIPNIMYLEFRTLNFHQLGTEWQTGIFF